MTVFNEIELVNIRVIKAREPQAGLERMRLGNFFHRFEKSPAIGEAKILARAAGAYGFDRRGSIAKH